MTHEILNSLKINQKKDLADISSKDVKSDKRFKGNKSNVLNIVRKIFIKFSKLLTMFKNRQMFL